MLKLVQHVANSSVSESNQALLPIQVLPKHGCGGAFIQMLSNVVKCCQNVDIVSKLRESQDDLGPNSSSSSLSCSCCLSSWWTCWWWFQNPRIRWTHGNPSQALHFVAGLSLQCPSRSQLHGHYPEQFGKKELKLMSGCSSHLTCLCVAASESNEKLTCVSLQQIWRIPREMTSNQTLANLLGLLLLWFRPQPKILLFHVS